MTAGEYLQRGREIRGLSQYDIATQVGVKQPTVFEWELGHCFPRLDRLPVVAEAYGVDDEELLRLRRRDVARKKLEGERKKGAKAKSAASRKRAA